MVTEEGKFLFKILKLPVKYDIDKNLLKKNYYQLSKESHPDIHHSSSFPIDIKLLNNAYSTLNDDFYRAKLFTKPTEILDNKFLEKCLELEEKIGMGEDLSEEIRRRIDQCKLDYTNPRSMAEWGYYRRLLKQINEKS